MANAMYLALSSVLVCTSEADPQNVSIIGHLFGGYDIMKGHPKPDWIQTYNAKSTHANTDLSMWKPRLPEGMCYFGDACQNNYSTPQYNPFIYPCNDGPEVPLADPDGMIRIWVDNGHGFFKPKCPKHFIALGVVGENFLSDRDISPSPALWPGLKCIHESLVQPAVYRSITWTDHGSTAAMGVTVFAGFQLDGGGINFVTPCEAIPGYPESAYWFKPKVHKPVNSMAMYNDTALTIV